MCAMERQMSFHRKHSCIQEKLVILSNADLISEIGIHTEELTYGTTLGWSFYERDRPISI